MTAPWKSFQRLVSKILGEQPVIAVRAATREDLGEIAGIQAASPEAAQWKPESYLAHGCLVAVMDGRVAAFLAYRPTAPGEAEILNLAVAPAARRRGAATALVKATLTRQEGVLFLEVRESNSAARKLYQKLGFREVGLRRNYYQSPLEDGIVMRY